MQKFEISGGVLGLLCGANETKAPSEYTFYLSGDLCQMSTQKTFLIRHGFDVSQSNVYPVLKQADVKRALELIYKYRIEGWWQYEEKYAELGICDHEEFRKELTAQVERDKK